MFQDRANGRVILDTWQEAVAAQEKYMGFYLGVVMTFGLYLISAAAYYHQHYYSSSSSSSSSNGYGSSSNVVFRLPGVGSHSCVHHDTRL